MEERSPTHLDFDVDYPKGSLIKWKYYLSHLISSYAIAVALAGGYLNFRGGIFGDLGFKLWKYPLWYLLTIPVSWTIYMAVRLALQLGGLFLLDFEDWLHEAP